MLETNETRKLSFLDILVLILSIYVLITLVAESVFNLSTEVKRLFLLVDYLVCSVFLIDFIYRFKKAQSKLEFMKWGWIDLLSSIPVIEYLYYGRLVRVYRILKVLRAFRSVKLMLQHFYVNKAKGAFASVIILAVMMIIFGSISVLQVEHDPRSQIKTAEDAIWWSFVTVTTLGYGDKIPITTEGRIIAIFLMITKLGLFGTFAGFAASFFIGDKPKNDT
jgi:voltage-gated potassium channel